MAKVLVADDSIAVRKVAERHLVQAGLEVTLVASGTEAITLLSTEQPDLIISDVIMPDKSGFDVCNFVRSQPALANTPFLLISGIVNDEVNRQAKACGADGVIKKPFQGNSLKEQALALVAKSQTATPPAEPSSPAVVESAAPHVDQGRAVEVTQLLSEKAQLEITIQELQSSLIREKQRVADVTEQASDATKLGKQIHELQEAKTQLEAQVKESQEALVQEKERAAAVPELEKAKSQLEAQIKDLRDALEKEQKEMAAVSHQLEEALKKNEQGKELDHQLDQVRQSNSELVAEVEALKAKAARLEEIEGLLEKECDRTSSLTQKLSEAEVVAAKAQARKEEIARKLNEIANLSK